MQKFIPDRTLKRLEGVVLLINKEEPSVQTLGEDELKTASADLRKRVLEEEGGGAALDAALPRAFALVREAARRVLRQRHFDVQLMGGAALLLEPVDVSQSA
ncbi:MAG: hypothetical protein AAB601_00655, partial [Patescibacteria group bacterium]